METLIEEKTAAKPEKVVAKNWEPLVNRKTSYQKRTKAALLDSMAKHLEFSLRKNRFNLRDFDIYQSLALAIRDRLIESWNDTHFCHHQNDCKRIYYLSLEYLMGRSLKNHIISLGMEETCKRVLAEMGYDLETILEMEPDAGLGNGGLGRLAACFLDSMATLNLPGYGYGIRYEFGIFEQKIENGEQVEYSDNWLSQGNPFEIPQKDIFYKVSFYGKLIPSENGASSQWIDTQDILATPYDYPIPGYRNHMVNNLRLWSATPSKNFDFQLFNAGDYFKAMEEKLKSQTLSSVLYPNDGTLTGKELRLKQQYFLVSASLQDIIRRYKEDHSSFEQFPDKVAIQLNETHPSLAVPELMRLLIDEEKLGWDEAWAICTQVFAYTNHTILPEALEKWPVDLLETLLPRHLQIIYQINYLFLEDVRQNISDAPEFIQQVSLIEENQPKMVRMSHLAIIGSQWVNGVSRLHTNILKEQLFAPFHAIFPNKIQNKTNGISPRRWLLETNPALSSLISETIGSKWITDLKQLEQLQKFAKKPDFIKQWKRVKASNKEALAQWLQKAKGISIDPSFMFDVQVKRIHEYKRQLLNVLHLVAQYNQIKESTKEGYTPRVVFFGGKAAPGYHMAKLIIHLIHDVAKVINHDPDVSQVLKVVFLENYNVSLTERLLPATDISQHISMAGTEASGTGNMKFALNGALLLGSKDGATLEIEEQVGSENLFQFGHAFEEISQIKNQSYNPRVYYQNSPELMKALEMINTGYFNREQPHLYNDIYNSLVYEDSFFVIADFDSYAEAQKKVAQTYLDQKSWIQKSILNVARMGYFSSDRSITEYNHDIWETKPMKMCKTPCKVR